MAKIEKVFEGCQLAEGPHWDEASQTLYFVDISGKQILNYDPITEEVARADLAKGSHFIIPVEGKENQFVVAQGGDLQVISWDGKSAKATVEETLHSIDKDFNDSKCDSTGRLWTGDMQINWKDFFKTEAVGTLYSFNSKRELKSHVDKVRCSNGIAINEKTKKLYYIDTLSGTIEQFTVDIEEGTLTNREVWFTFGKSVGKSSHYGLPDGMTIDSDGNLWVTVNGSEGSSVVKIDGSKKDTVLETHILPAKMVTSACFGGANFDELYVTAGAMEMPPTSEGAVFKVTELGVKGLPAFKFKLD